MSKKPDNIEQLAEEAMHVAFAHIAEKLDPKEKHDLGGYFGYECEPLAERVESALDNAVKLAVVYIGHREDTNKGYQQVDSLHAKQSDAESLAVHLQTCCAYENSVLVEGGISSDTNEFYYRVVEHYINIDEACPKSLARVADILEVLAKQFRNASEHIQAEQEDESRKT